MGFRPYWTMLNAADFDTPQKRSRVFLIALHESETGELAWPFPSLSAPKTVGATVGDLMTAGGWQGAKAWAVKANRVAPTIVGGSKKHGGPDLGPARARKEWATLGVDGPRHSEFPPAPRLQWSATAYSPHGCSNSRVPRFMGVLRRQDTPMSPDRERLAATAGESSCRRLGSMPALKGKAAIRAFLLDRIGQVVTTEEIRDASGNQVQYSRRLRELREEEGWPIHSHNDAVDLKPGEYRLSAPPPAEPPIKFARNVSAKLRAQVLDRNGNTCQQCGIAAGELDDRNDRPARLHVAHVVDKSHGGGDTLDNLRALCSQCNQGAKNVTQEPPRHVWLMTQVRRASEADQRKVMTWLMAKFTGPRAKIEEE